MLLVFVFLLLLLAGLWLFWTADGGLVIRIEADELQDRLEAQFPIVKDLRLVEVRLTDPVLSPDPESQRVTVRSQLWAESKLFRDLEEIALMSGSLRYAPDRGEVFLDQVAVVLEAQDEHDDRRKSIEAAATALAESYFAEHPIYVIDESDMKSRLARAFLTEIDISKRAIRLRFDPNAQ